MIECKVKTKILILLQLIFLLSTISCVGCYATPAPAINQAVPPANYNKSYNNQSDTFPMRQNTYTGFASIVKIPSGNDDINKNKSKYNKNQTTNEDDDKNYLKIKEYGLILDNPVNLIKKPNTTSPAAAPRIYRMLLSTKIIKEKYPDYYNNSKADNEDLNTIINQRIKDKYRMWINAKITTSTTAAAAALYIDDYEIIPYETAQLIPSNPSNNNNKATPVNVKFDEVAAWTDRMPGSGGGENNSRRHLLLNFSVTNPDTQNKYSINLDRVFISFNQQKEGKLPRNQITFVDENSNLPTPDTTETQINPSSENVNIRLRGINVFPPDHAENQIIYVTVIFSINKINTNTTPAATTTTYITLRQQGEIMVVW